MRIKIAYLPATDDAVTDWEFPDYTQAVEFMESRMCKSCMCKSMEEMAQRLEGYSKQDIEMEWKYTALPQDYDMKDPKGKMRALFGTGCGCEYVWEEEDESE